MLHKRKTGAATPRRTRRLRRRRFGADPRSAPGLRHLNWFDANIAVYLMENGGALPVAKALVTRKGSGEGEEAAVSEGA